MGIHTQLSLKKRSKTNLIERNIYLHQPKMNCLLVFGLVLIAGSSNACGPQMYQIPPNILDILKEMTGHIGHDHKHGHHHDGITEVVMEHLGGKYVFSELDRPCPPGLMPACFDLECCLEAMQLYKSNRRIKKITENDPTHPPGCHVMHATGEWHFNPLRPDFNPDLIVKGVHAICHAKPPKWQVPKTLN